jgi:hypothetical protein
MTWWDQRAPFGNWTNGHVHAMADGYPRGQDSEGWMVQKYVLDV